MNAQNCPGLVGIAMRAGKLVLGEDACLDSIRAGSAQLVLIDEGVSPGTFKRFSDACASHDTALAVIKAGQLGHMIGKESRLTAVVRDQGFAHGIQKSLSKQNGNA